MEELQYFIRSNTWASDLIGRGWGNGYVALPKEHPCYGMDYNKIDVRVHWGLTFGDYADNLYKEDWELIPEGLEGTYIVGFDTSHCDSAELFPTEKEVLEETLSLRNQLTNPKFFDKLRKKMLKKIVKYEKKITECQEMIVSVEQIKEGLNE